ncbi:RICIN domain-containing protein [Streptomyces sp. NPDC047082]|uniref:RICIN domain-containing protein n=1 Tax=Streptomyces sp. NPDC047082 TaxID=3155259 RepID=UPI0033E5EB1C
MSARRRVLSACTTGIAVAALALASAPPAAAVDFPNQDLINKASGGRLALFLDHVSEGSIPVTLRDPAFSFSTEAWDGYGSFANEEWTFKLKNRAANKCLQPVDASPARGSAVTVKNCNDSDNQLWSLQAERVGGSPTGWWVWQPVLNRNIALTVKQYAENGRYETLYLDTAYPSSDRLWKLAHNDATW